MVTHPVTKEIALKIYVFELSSNRVVAVVATDMMITSDALILWHTTINIHVTYVTFVLLLPYTTVNKSDLCYMSFESM